MEILSTKKYMRSIALELLLLVNVCDCVDFKSCEECMIDILTIRYKIYIILKSSGVTNQSLGEYRKQPKKIEIENLGWDIMKLSKYCEHCGVYNMCPGCFLKAHKIITSDCLYKD